MNCKDYRNRINAYVDGLLAPAEKELFESHGASCAECRTQAAELKALRLSLLSLKKMPAKPEFESSVMAKINSAAYHSYFFEVFFRAAKSSILAAAFVFVIITAFSYFTPSVAASKTPDNGIAFLNRYVLQSFSIDMRNEKLILGR